MQYFRIYQILEDRNDHRKFNLRYMAEACNSGRTQIVQIDWPDLYFEDGL